MSLRRVLYLAALALISLCPALRAAEAQPTTELLWPKGAPGAKGDKPEDKPTIAIYLPEVTKGKSRETAVIVLPGGGYRGLATGHEGKEIAAFWNEQGIAAFVVEYRHRGRGYGHPAPLQDAQRAVRIVRSRAAEFGISPSKIGVMGFSAGGHLASTVGTHFDAGKADADDAIEKASSHPDFLILCYPVIAFDQPFTHRGSQNNLLGADAPKELVASLSNEKQVTAETPPTFLFHTSEDTAVPPENSIVFYLALKQAKVPAELHIYAQGPHGVGLAKGNPAISPWSGRLLDWMKSRGL